MRASDAPAGLEAAVVWHEVECGGYTADLPLWRALATAAHGPVLDVGAGTGRVALDLARHGHDVTALDRDARLLARLRERAAGLPVHAVCADAREFSLPERFGLCVVPMQTVQILGGERARCSFLACALTHLRPGAVLAVALAEALEEFSPASGAAPLPDIAEHEGFVFASHPVAIRHEGGRTALERRRETVDPAGRHSETRDVVHLDRLSRAQLEREGLEAGLRVHGVTPIPRTADHVGGEIVLLAAPARPTRRGAQRPPLP